MANELQIFESSEFGKVRTLVKDNGPWFVAVDVCEILEIKNPTDALKRLDNDERTRFNLGRQGEANLVNEYGLYSLILGSRKPEAKAFKRWITHEVIPSIRKTGSYTVKQKEPTFVQQQRAEAMLLNARSRQSKLWLSIAEKTDIKEYKHICQQKAAEVLAGVPILPMEQVEEKTYSAAEIGKMLGVSANKIGKIANEHGLKTEQYGKLFYSKSEYSCKEVETWRYYDSAIPEFERIIGRKAVA